jgi:streptogramin lyase
VFSAHTNKQSFVKGAVPVTLRSAVAFLTFALLTFLMLGCTLPVASPTSPAQGLAIRGSVHGGQQPVAGAHVYLFAANTTGYGSASVSLLNSASTGNSDSTGAYVLTGSDGSFSISGDYSCSPNTQVYLYASGGNPGAGANSHDGFLAVLGNCPNSDNFATATPSIAMNEVTTVAAAYAIAGYATDATHVSSSGTALAQTGIGNAFANAANLVDISTGTARTTTLGGNGTVPTATIYTLANILAACVNTADQTFPPNFPSSACYSLITSASSQGNGRGGYAADTATAAINIAHYPADRVSTYYNLPNGNTAFGGGLTTQPSDFTLTLVFSGGGISAARHLAVDGAGNVWVSDYSALVEKLSPLGAFLSGSGGYTDSSLNGPAGMAIDASGNGWVVNSGGGNSTVTGFSSTNGAEFANPSLSAFGQYMAFDTSGNLWAPNSRSSNDGVLAEITGGSVAHTYNIANQPSSIVIDPSNNLWIGNINNGKVSKVSGGSVQSPSPYSMNFGSAIPEELALDSSGDIWALGSDASISAISSSGTVFTNAPYNTGTGLSGEAIALDGANTIYTLNELFNFMNFSFTYQLSQFTYSSGALTAVGSFVPPGDQVYDLAVDGSGNLWVAAEDQVDEIVGLATPVVTPVAANLVAPYSAAASKP